MTTQAPAAAPRTSRVTYWTTALLAVAILVPSLWGFGSKFIEFVTLARGDVEGVFAISPVVNYLLASLGFLFLLGWAAMQGMFRDIEAPKYEMLENERRLDAAHAQRPA
jgi:hypothetical protein